jgi:hypothetical protein
VLDYSFGLILVTHSVLSIGSYVARIRSPNNTHKNISPFIHNMQELLIQTFHSFSTLISTYSVLNHSPYLGHCKYLIQSICIIDIILHYSNLKKLKPDMVIHHSFTIGLIYIYSHYIHQTNPQLIHKIDHTLLSTEISNNFLIIHNALKLLHMSHTRIGYINQYLFVLSFAYYRIYVFSYNIILSYDTHHDIIHTVQNTHILIPIYTCIYGLFLLNILWASVLIQRIYSQIKSLTPLYQF